MKWWMQSALHSLHEADSRKQRAVDRATRCALQVRLAAAGDGAASEVEQRACLAPHIAARYVMLPDIKRAAMNFLDVCW
jgi:hypothetical protein